MTSKQDTRTVWQLAGLADVQSPDSLTSPGAEWLERVAVAAAELIEENPEASADDLADSVHEYADGVVPIYTHNRWQVFVDLCAYTEDVEELGADASDMTQCAGVALYMIAERLILAIVAEDAGADDEDDEDE